MFHDRKNNQLWRGSGFLLHIVGLPDERGHPVVGIEDLNPDMKIRARMSRTDMLKVATWFFINAWRNAR